MGKKGKRRRGEKAKIALQKLSPLSPFTLFTFSPSFLSTKTLTDVVVAHQTPQGPPVGAVGGDGNLVQLGQKGGDGLGGQNLPGLDRSPAGHDLEGRLPHLLGPV